MKERAKELLYQLANGRGSMRECVNELADLMFPEPVTVWPEPPVGTLMPVGDWPTIEGEMRDQIAQSKEEGKEEGKDKGKKK